MEFGRNIELHENDKITSRNSISNEIKSPKTNIQILALFYILYLYLFAFILFLYEYFYSIMTRMLTHIMLSSYIY